VKWCVRSGRVIEGDGRCGRCRFIGSADAYELRPGTGELRWPVCIAFEDRRDAESRGSRKRVRWDHESGAEAMLSIVLYFAMAIGMLIVSAIAGWSW